MVIKCHSSSQPRLSSSRHKIFRGRVVHSKSLKRLEIIDNATLGVRPDGTIAFLHRSEGSPDRIDGASVPKEFHDAEVWFLKRSEFLFPGMIDTHLHAPQWPNLALGMEGTLQEWCENYTDPIEASYSSNSKAHQVYSDVVRTTLALGSTTIAYNTTTHCAATNILADTCLAAGQRAIVGKLCILVGSTHGNWEDSTETALADTEECIQHIRRIDPEGKLLHACVQPRGGPYCPPTLMNGLGALSTKYNTRVQAHMCETPSDIQRTLALHKPHTSYSSMYLSHGLLHPRTILAHSIHLLPPDLLNLQLTNAGVAHNPNSNTCLRDGICRVRDLLDAGIKVGLGTDCSAGYMPSIHEAMRAASNVSRHLAVNSGEERYVLSFNEIVHLATMGGAGVVGMADEIGNFDPGKKFDALVIDVDDVISADKSLWEEGRGDGGEAMVKKWVFLGDDRTIRRVYVNGVWVSGQDRE